MKLRSQIFLILLLFGLIPLLAAVTINLPLVLQKIQLFYNKAHLQNLRADFRDLDQHLASRQEMLRLLTRMPDPQLILQSDDVSASNEHRLRLTQWIGQILPTQFDIAQLLFVDGEGMPRFWLERELESGRWLPVEQLTMQPEAAFLSEIDKLQPGQVLISHIALREHQPEEDPRRLVTLHLMSPIFSAEPIALGAVVITIDVGGLARSYRDTFWVKNNGEYLLPEQRPGSSRDARNDFPGLQAIFQQATVDLWTGANGDQVIWVPMFKTERSGPLWVGRKVDPSPLQSFRKALVLSVSLIVLILVIGIFLFARRISVIVERFGTHLTDAISQILEGHRPQHLNWGGPREVTMLGRNLTALASNYAEQMHAVQRQAEALEASNQYKTQFLANVSHELKTPLNSILLLSKILGGDGNLSADQRRQADVIHNAGKDLQSLIENMLNMSQIEAGQMRVQKEPTDLRRMLDNLGQVLEPQFANKGLKLKLRCDLPAAFQIDTDEDKARQILTNFLSNALKFTPVGGEVSMLARLAGDDSLLEIEVRDSGIGIAPEKQSLIFENFRQADEATNRKYGGTGLGLAISRELAQLLGGDIRLQSSLGAGASFTLVLPLGQMALDKPPCAEPAPALPNPAQPQVNPELVRAGAGRVLFILSDRMEEILRLSALAEQLSFEVYAAADLHESLETLQEIEPDLILLSLNQPLPQQRQLLQELAPGRDRHCLILTPAGQPAGLPPSATGTRYLPGDLSDQELAQALGHRPARD